MDKIRYGIIGVGNMGTTHLKNFMDGKVEGATVVAAADVKEERRAFVRENYPTVKVYDSGDELIDNADVDAVVIVVPHYFHPPLAIRALNRGLSVICEKPAGVYTKQVKEMNAAAAKSKGQIGRAHV